MPPELGKYCLVTMYYDILYTILVCNTYTLINSSKDLRCNSISKALKVRYNTTSMDHPAFKID